METIMLQALSNLSKHFIPAHRQNLKVSHDLSSKMKQHWKESHKTLRNIQQQTLKGNFSQVPALYQNYFKQQAQAFKDMVHHSAQRGATVAAAALSVPQKKDVKGSSSSEKPTFFSNLAQINKFNMALLASLASLSMPHLAISKDLALTGAQEASQHSLKAVRAGEAALESITSEQLKALMDLTEAYATNTKAAQGLVQEAKKKGSSKGSGQTTEQALMADFLKSLQKNITVDLVTKTFSDLNQKLHRIWEHKESAEVENLLASDKKTASKWAGYVKDTSLKVAKSYATIQWGMMKLSWKVGTNMVLDLGPKLVALTAKEMMGVLPLFL